MKTRTRPIRQILVTAITAVIAIAAAGQIGPLNHRGIGLNRVDNDQTPTARATGAMPQF